MDILNPVLFHRFGEWRVEILEEIPRFL